MEGGVTKQWFKLGFCYNVCKTQYLYSVWAMWKVYQ